MAMSQRGKAGRDLVQVGRDFNQKIVQNRKTVHNNSFSTKFSSSLVLFALSVAAIAIDVFYLKGSGFLNQAGAANISFSAVIAIPTAAFIIGFIPILGGLSFTAFLFLSVASLQQPSYLIGCLGLLTGVMSGVSFRRSF
jgi:hypothetical protein